MRRLLDSWLYTSFFLQIFSSVVEGTVIFNAVDGPDSGVVTRIEYDHIPPNKKCMALLLAEERFLKIKQTMEEEQNQPEVMQELLLKLMKDLQILKGSQQEKKEMAAQTKAITPDLPIEEPDNSLSMGDEHLSTIPETESDELIKSSVENLVPIPSEFEGISEDMCDVPVCEDPSPFDALYDHSEILSDPNDDDVILHEKLLNINRLIANIESLNDNSTPNCVLKSTSPFPIPDSNSFFEKSDTSLFYSDNSLPEFESLTSVVMEDILGEPRVHVPNVLPTHPTLMMDSDVIIRTFLPYFTYLMDSSFPPSSGNEDTIFDPDISTFHFSSLKPVAYENPIVIFLFFCFCPKDKGIRGESS
ncbi:hypothetical protein Tco_1281796 [Tanacetum coccineum]